MNNGGKILGIIPARGGSKGLPGKNILPLLGKPLILWTIEQAFLSRYLDKIIVSTEDEEIAEIVKKNGAEVPFIRPVELATDHAKGIDVVIHAIDWFETNKNYFDMVMLLQPTSPLRTSQDIDNAVECLFLKKAKGVVSICETEHPPLWSNSLPADGCMKDFLRPEILNKNRQEIQVFYRINGAIYLADCNYLKSQKSFFGKETYAYVMPKERSIDIDTDIDFKFAEFLLQRIQLDGKEH